MPTRRPWLGTQRNPLCKKKRSAAHSGWHVSFAELMGLMSFFVMLVASTLGFGKSSKSSHLMRDDFGVQTRRSIRASSSPATSRPAPVSGAQDCGSLEPSADRANGVHLPTSTQSPQKAPLFADDPSVSAKSRVTITLMREDPARPPDLKP